MSTDELSLVTADRMGAVALNRPTPFSVELGRPDSKFYIAYSPNNILPGKSTLIL